MCIRDRNKKDYDKRVKAKAKNYEIGDHVYLRDITIKKGRRKKFSENWKGPYEIIQILNNVNIKIRIGKGKFLIVHIDRLKASKACHRKRNLVIRELPQPQGNNDVTLDRDISDTAEVETTAVLKSPLPTALSSQNILTYH